MSSSSPNLPAERPWAPITLTGLWKQGAWRKPPGLTLLAGWVLLTLLCGWYGFYGQDSPFAQIHLLSGKVTIFWPLVIAATVLFWFGLEWALVIVIAGSLGAGLHFGLPLKWLIPFCFADTAGLILLALIYRLSGLSYVPRRPLSALGYLTSALFATLMISAGSLFLSQAADAQPSQAMARWYAWWLGGFLAVWLAAGVMYLFSDRVENWKERHFGPPAAASPSFGFLVFNTLLGAVLAAALVFGVSDMAWQRLEETFLLGTMERIHRSTLMLRALWLLLSQMTVLLFLGLFAGGVALAWGWNRRYHRESSRRDHLLEAAEHRFQSTFHGAPIGLAQLSPDGRILLANRKFLTILGYEWEELSSLSYQDLLDPSLAAGPAGALIEQDARQPEFERAFRGKGNESVWCHARLSSSCSPSGAVESWNIALTDIPQKRTRDQQQQQKNRMDAVGSLAGGVAHDFNNLLTAIVGFTDIARAQVSREQSPVSSLDQVQKASERAADLTKQLLTLSRRELSDRNPVDLNAEIEATLRLMPPLLGDGIEVRFIRGETLGAINSGPTLISQLVLHLAATARDAMHGGGMIRMSTRAATVAAPGWRGLGPGDYIVLEFSDNGEPIPPEMLPRIFEPFFASKTLSRGTGLGLATVYGIVRQSGGDIQVSSSPDRGTSFSIYFPCLPQPAPAAPLATQPASAIPAGKRVLLVEDDSAVRLFLTTALERAGYHLTPAEHGVHALGLYSPGSFDLIVTDLAMPRMGGIEMVRRLRDLSPDVPVVFMSGYSTEAQRQGIPGIFVQKPFTLDRLLHAMEKATAGVPLESSPLRSAT
jgi:PAS domain S-box-containing protein